MKIYLSGPISGYDIDERKAVFSNAAEKLTSKGYDVFNPIETIVQKPYSEYIRHDLKQLLDCDAIYILNGWRDSEGCRIEYQVAKAIGIKIFKEEYSNSNVCEL